MKQVEKLTEEEVHYILGAFDVATGEHGGDYSDIKNKLYRMYPAVKAEDDDYVVRVQQASDEQDEKRKSITKLVYNGLHLNMRILPQLKTWIAFESNYDLLSKHYSDEICLSGDLWKYHLSELKRAGLLDELRSHLEAESQKKGNEWMRHDDETDDDLWHTLVRILESARRG